MLEMQGGGRGGGFLNFQPQNQNPLFTSSASTLQEYFHGYNHSNYSSFTNFSPQNPIQTPIPQSSAATSYGSWGFLVPSSSINVNLTGSGEIFSNPSWPAMHDIKFSDASLLDEEGGSEERERRQNEASTKSGDQEVSNGKRISKAKEQPLIKGQWTKEEDRLLIYLVNEHGPKRWTPIAKSLKGRAGKQCRERWHNHLRPNIKRDAWTKEEEAILAESHRIHGSKWSQIAKCIPGQTENNIKNHWNVTLRKLQNNPTRKSRRISIKAPSTPLERYILSLTQPSNAQNPKSDSSPAPSPSYSALSISTSFSGEGSSQGLWGSINEENVLEASGNSDPSPSVPMRFPPPMQCSLMNESNNNSGRSFVGADHQVWALDGLDGMQQDVVGESSADQNMMMIPNDQATYCPTYSIDDNSLLDHGVATNYDYQAMSDDVMMMLINHQDIA